MDYFDEVLVMAKERQLRENGSIYWQPCKGFSTGGKLFFVNRGSRQEQ